MPQISFPLAKAHEALDQFLTGPDACDHLGNRYSRTILDANGQDAVAVFLRAEGNGFFGEEWSIVTGSGYKLFAGWWTREDAARAVAAIGRVLPFIDWMSASADQLTIRSKKALLATVKRYHFAGVREDQPEPEPLTEDGATVEATA